MWRIDRFNMYFDQLLSSLLRVFVDVLVFYILLIVFKKLSLFINQAKQKKA